MENKQPSMIDLLVETHKGLERQGPGSFEMTTKALSFLDDLDTISQATDLGCGSGGQTMVLAQHINGDIVGVDFLPDFINVLNNKAQKHNLEERVKGVVGSMDSLPFPKESLDLIWSEGAIDNIGFEKGLSHWHGFLKAGGYAAVTSPSWFTEEHPAEVEKFWSDAGSGLDTIENHIETLQKVGYQFVASFALPEQCWTDNYFLPREAALRALAKKYAGNKTVEDYISDNNYEVELYSKYKKYYGYAFYIGKKI